MGVRIDFSRRGKPMDNAFVESFNGTLRGECLDAHWFTTPAEAKHLIELWRREDNESRPHRALGEETLGVSTSQFAAQRELTGSDVGRTRYGTAATTSFTKVSPFGVPRPVTLSHPRPVVNDESVPKVRTNQRVENGLLYMALK